jgi:hypothetical protein
MPSLRPQELMILVVMLLFTVAVAVVLVWAGTSLARRSGRARQVNGSGLTMPPSAASTICRSCGATTQTSARSCARCGAARSP